MSPYKIVMQVNNYSDNKEPLYTITIYTKEGKIYQNWKDLRKEKAIKAIAEYCGIVI